MKLAIPEAQAVYAAAWPLTIVPLDSTTYVRLEDRERETLRKAGTPLVIALEALLRLWADGPDSRMTLHDQLALAEAQHRRPVLRPLRADAAARRRRRLHPGRSGQRPARAVCLEPKRDEFMKHYLAQLAAQVTGDQAPSSSRRGAPTILE